MNRSLSLATILYISMLFSCTDVQRDNPYDSGGTNYKGYDSSDSIVSSSSAISIVSSSSFSPSSSSELLSSSSLVPSSPSELLSSSSVPSSSSAPSSSSNAPLTSFNMIAFIYDTDKSVNPSFEEYQVDGIDGTGIVKNMVKKYLNPTGKIECDQCTAGNGTSGGFRSPDLFAAAFKDYAKGDKSAKNVKLCYEMPLKLTESGYFEFDSDLMKNHSGVLVGGFFPEVLDNQMIGEASVVPGAADYSDCPACRTKREADSFVPLDATKVNPWCFNHGFATINVTGETMASCGAAYGAGDFINGDKPVVWDWGKRPNVALWGGTAATKREANQHFCFESHAEFTYTPDQEFLFRGDDDIWVYINNKLVIDLGGSHLAAPGAVMLDTLGLGEGNLYPIDIFFCDRRTTMSNVRISTNISLTQTAVQKGNCGDR